VALRPGAAVALAAVLLLGAGTAEDAVRPRYGGTGVRGFVGAIRTLDPLLAQTAIEREAARAVHAGLFRFDRDGEPVPDLVERVEVERDGTSVRLLLRRAWFHDGRQLTAEDARAAIERFAAAPGAGRLLATAGPVVAVAGERELRLRVGAAPVLWPWLLADVRASILPAGAGAPGRGTVGAGPFLVTDLSVRGDRLVLKPNERHHRGRPLLDHLEYRAVADERALALAHRHQGVDVIDQAGAVEAGAAAPVGAGFEVVVLQVNPARAPLDAPGVRDAILRAVRIDALVDVVLGGAAERAPGILPLRPLLAEQPPAPAPQDDGRVATAFAKPLAFVYPEGKELRAAAERIRVDLHAAGVSLLPRGLPADEFAAALANGSFDLALVILPGGGMPPVMALGEVAALLAAELPRPLVAAAASVQAGGELGSDLFAAEAAILEGSRLRPLFRRERRILCRESLRDVVMGPDGAAAFEDAWRWTAP
jgi:MarR-like DNA-binding transcriptional regulator SgrR of sgrS sRNA